MIRVYDQLEKSGLPKCYRVGPLSATTEHPNHNSCSSTSPLIAGLNCQSLQIANIASPQVDTVHARTVTNSTVAVD